jgi:hypothetical protein
LKGTYRTELSLNNEHKGANVFKRKRKKKVASQHQGPGRPIGPEKKKINTEFFEFVENIPEHARRRKSARAGGQNSRIVADFRATGFTRGFLTAEQLDIPPSSMGGLVASINRHAIINDYKVYARLISGLLVLERSNRKMRKRSQKVGT